MGFDDKLGFPIEVGSWILYAVRDGDKAALRIGRVVKRGSDGSIFVQGIDEGYWVGSPLRLNKRLGKLEYGNRVVVIPESQVPAKYLALFVGE